MDQFDVVFPICYFLDCVDLLRLRLVNRSLMCFTLEAWKDLKKTQPLISSLEKNSSLMNNLLYGNIKSFTIKKSKVFERILFVDSQFVVCLSKTKRDQKYCVQVFSIKNQLEVFSSSSKKTFHSAQINYPLLLLKLHNCIKVFDLRLKHQLLVDFLYDSDHCWLIKQQLVIFRKSNEQRFITLNIHNFALPRNDKKRELKKSFHFSNLITATQLTKDRFLFIGIIGNAQKCSILCCDIFSPELTFDCLFELETRDEIRKFVILESGDVIAVVWYGCVWFKYENEKFVLGGKLMVEKIIWKFFFLTDSILGEKSYETLQWFYKESKVRILKSQIGFYHIKDNYSMIENDIFLLNENNQDLKKINTNSFTDGILNEDTIGHCDSGIDFYDIITQTKIRHFPHWVEQFNLKCFFWLDDLTSKLNLLSY